MVHQKKRMMLSRIINLKRRSLFWINNDGFLPIYPDGYAEKLSVRKDHIFRGKDLEVSCITDRNDPANRHFTTDEVKICVLDGELHVLNDDKVVWIHKFAGKTDSFAVVISTK